MEKIEAVKKRMNYALLMENVRKVSNVQNGHKRFVPVTAFVY